MTVAPGIIIQLFNVDYLFLFLISRRRRGEERKNERVKKKKKRVWMVISSSRSVRLPPQPVSTAPNLCTRKLCSAAVRVHQTSCSFLLHIFLFSFSLHYCLSIKRQKPLCLALPFTNSSFKFPLRLFKNNLPQMLQYYTICLYSGVQ